MCSIMRKTFINGPTLRSSSLACFWKSSHPWRKISHDQSWAKEIPGWGSKYYQSTLLPLCESFASRMKGWICETWSKKAKVQTIALLQHVSFHHRFNPKKMEHNWTQPIWFVWHSQAMPRSVIQSKLGHLLGCFPIIIRSITPLCVPPPDVLIPGSS